MRLRTLCLTLPLLLAGCGSSDQTRDHEQKYGHLTHTLIMTDKDGKQYGTVELDPVGGGKVLDNDGRLIGNIVPPER